MELRGRARNDELLQPGEFTSIRARLRQLAPAHDVATVIAYAFDYRTRLLPFIRFHTRTDAFGRFELAVPAGSVARVGVRSANTMLWAKDRSPAGPTDRRALHTVDATAAT